MSRFVSALERHRDWWERMPLLTAFGAIVVAGWAISGSGPDWPFRAFAILWCADELLQAWANSVGLVRRYRPREEPPR